LALRADLEELFANLADTTRVQADHQPDDFLERVLSPQRVAAIAREGRKWNGAKRRHRFGFDADCHNHCAEISAKDPRYAWWCGFAWSAADPRNRWRLHSWLVDEDNEVVELTPIARTWYFGKPIHTHERLDWTNALREDPPEMEWVRVEPSR
jgi:hypothetical protein